MINPSVVLCTPGSGIPEKMIDYVGICGGMLCRRQETPKWERRHLRSPHPKELAELTPRPSGGGAASKLCFGGGLVVDRDAASIMPAHA